MLKNDHLAQFDPRFWPDVTPKRGVGRCRVSECAPAFDNQGAPRRLPEVMDLLQAVDRGWDTFHPGLDLKRQEL